MSEHNASPEIPASEAETQSLTELFHQVSSLIPEGQTLHTAPPHMTVAEALQLMQRRDFSQLPVVAGNTVLDVFSLRSLAVRLLEMGDMRQDLADLPVDEFLEPLEFVQPSDNWEAILDYLDSDDAVLVGRRDRLEGIVTPMDVLSYLRNIASPFVVLAEIELSLRRIIRACATEAELQMCIENSLSKKYSPAEMPATLSDMTVNDYIQIIVNGLNWPTFSVVFGEGDWQRKNTAAKLGDVSNLRNDVFHFRRQLTAEDYEKLTASRKWLQMKSIAFEAKKHGESVAVTERPDSAERQRDESTFLHEIAARRGDEEAAVASRILEWAEELPRPDVFPEHVEGVLRKAEGLIGPGEASRLRVFLGNGVVELGLAPANAKLWMPFKKHCLYHPERWEEPQRHPITVFYFWAHDADCGLSFPTTQFFANVVGFDVDHRVEELTDLGFQPEGSGQHPRIDLGMHNDQAFFDALFDVVARTVAVLEESLQQG